MAIDFDSIKPRTVSVPRRVGTKTGRDLGPNHWLNKKWEQGLWASYENDQAYGADFKGKIEKTPATRGEAKNKGELIERVTGEAGDAITLIRQAATKLGIGVSVPYTTEGVRNGYVRVTWYGKTKKVYKAKTATTVPPVVTSETQTEQKATTPPTAPAEAGK